jgi:hypothetical protein
MSIANAERSGKPRVNGLAIRMLTVPDHEASGRCETERQRRADQHRTCMPLEASGAHPRSMSMSHDRASREPSGGFNGRMRNRSRRLASRVNPPRRRRLDGPESSPKHRLDFVCAPTPTDPQQGRTFDADTAGHGFAEPRILSTPPLMAHHQATQHTT